MDVRAQAEVATEGSDSTDDGPPAQAQTSGRLQKERPAIKRRRQTTSRAKTCDDARPGDEKQHFDDDDDDDDDDDNDDDNNEESDGGDAGPSKKKTKHVSEKPALERLTAKTTAIKKPAIASRTSKTHYSAAPFQDAVTNSRDVLEDAPDTDMLDVQQDSLEVDIARKEGAQTVLQFGTGTGTEIYCSIPEPDINHLAEHKARNSELKVSSKISSEKHRRGPDRRKEKALHVVEMAGDPRNVRSFIEIDCNEQRVAAYLGYRDSVDIRKLCLSWPVIKSFLRFIKISHNLSKHRSLRLIVDLKSNFTDVENPKKKWNPPSTKEDILACNARYLACYLVDLEQDLDCMASALPEQNAQRQYQALADFRQAYPSNVLPTKSLVIGLEPAASNSLMIKVPRLGPYQSEGSLERTNRCWAILKYMKYLLQAKLWKSRMSNEGLSSSILVHESYIPQWLLPPKESPDALSKPTEVLAADTLPEKHFPIEWLQDQAFPGREDLDDALDEAYNARIMKPQARQILVVDPRLLNSLQAFRDSVRRQYLCQEIKMNIHMLTVTWEDPESKAKHEAASKADEWEGPSGLQTIFIHGTNVTAKVSFKALQNPDENIYESFDPLPAVAGFLSTTSGDVEINEPGVVAITRAMLPREPTEAVEISEAGNGNPKASSKMVSGQKSGASGVAEFLDHIWVSGESSNNIGSAPDPAKLVPKTKGAKNLLDYYNGYDVATPEGRRNWQYWVMKTVIRSSTTAHLELNRLPKRTFTKPEEEALTEAEAQIQRVAVAIEDQEPDQSRALADTDYYTIHSALSGTPAQAGPFLTPCLELLLCEKLSNQRYRSALLADVTKSEFYHYQITGAVGAILKLYGTIDPERLLAIPRARTFTPQERKQVREAATSEHLSDLRLHGCVLGDGVGLGKTKQLLLVAVLHSVLNDELSRAGKPVFHPTLLVVPPALINQWLNEIIRFWPYLKPIVSYDDHSFKDTMALSSLSFTAMKQFPSKKYFPANLKWLFDQTQKRNASTIIISSYDTHKNRAGIKKSEKIPGQRFTPNQKAPDGRTIWKKEPYMKHSWSTRHSGHYGLLLADESQKLRNFSTGTYSVLLMHSFRKTVLATATPVFNTIKDIMGVLCLLWPAISAEIQKLERQDCYFKDFLSDESIDEDIIESASMLPPKALGRLLMMNPRLVKNALKTKEHTQIAALVQPVLEQLMIRRSATSAIPDLSDSHDLKMLFKKHVRTTAYCSYLPSELPEYHMFHRVHAREYYQHIHCGMERDQPLPTNPAPMAQNIAFVTPVGPLRRLAFANFATKMARLNMAMETASINSHVGQLQLWQSQELGARFIHDIVRGPGEEEATTAAGLVKYLCEGSPPTRLAFQEILATFAIEPVDPSKYRCHQKLLIGESHPANAFYLQVVLREALVDARVMHSGLSTPARSRLVDLFNDPRSSCRVLIMLYDVSAAGLNLEASCNRVLLASIGRHFAAEEQLAGRTMRITSRFPTTVVRRHTCNSHDDFQASLQTDKASLQLMAARQEKSIRLLIVKLLNEMQPEVDSCHQSSDGLALLRRLCERRDERIACVEKMKGQARQARKAKNDSKSDANSAGEKAFQTMDKVKTSKTRAENKHFGRGGHEKFKAHSSSELDYDDKIDLMLDEVEAAARKRGAAKDVCGACNGEVTQEDQFACGEYFDVYHISCVEKDTERSDWSCGKCHTSSQSRKEAAKPKGKAKTKAKAISRSSSVFSAIKCEDEDEEDYEWSAQKSGEDGEESDSVVESNSDPGGPEDDYGDVVPGRGRIQQQEEDEGEQTEDVAYVRAEEIEKFTAEEQLDEDECHLLALLSLSAGKTWTEKDLDTEHILRMGMLLLNNKIEGKKSISVHAPIHIKYTSFPAKLIEDMKKRAREEAAQR